MNKDSVLVGGTVHYTVEIIFDSRKVQPDLDIFEKSIDVLPLDKTAVNQSQYFPGVGLTRYIIEFDLQAVNVALDTRYQLDPVVVYYTSPDDSVLKSYEIKAPSIHITSYYPENIAGIELKPIKGEITVISSLGQFVLGISGLLIVVMVLYSVIKLCTRMPETRLSEYENLWLQYQKLKSEEKDSRAWLISAEKIFSRIASVKLGIKPAEFWSGKLPDDALWQEILETSRNSIKMIYQMDGPDEKDIHDFDLVLNKSFSEVLSEEKRNVLNQQNFIKRYFNQKKLVVLTSGGLVLGILLTISAIWPKLWISDIVIRYNTLVQQAMLEEVSDSVAEGFSELGDEITAKEIKAASLYNAATLMSDSLQVINEDQALSIGDSFSMLATNEQIIQDTEDLLFVLTDNIDTYREAETRLREAIRANSGDEDIARNLEIIIKRRKAALYIINTLVNTGHIVPQQIDELLDLMESQMALEFDMDEGQEAPGYYIGEDF